MTSALTRNSIVAFIAAFAISFGLYLVGRLTQFAPEALRGLFAFLSIDSHFENISRGVIDSRDVIYYLWVIGVSLLWRRCRSSRGGGDSHGRTGLREDDRRRRNAGGAAPR